MNARKATTARRAITAVMAALALAFTLCVASGCQPSSEDVIRTTVQEKFDAYKNLEDAVLSEIASKAEQEGLDELGISGQDYASAVLNGFDYHIDDVTVDEQAATVSMSIASKSKSDFYNRLNEAVTAFVQDPATESLSDEDKDARIGEIAMQTFEQTDVVNENVQLQFQLEGNTWTSTNSSEVLGNLDSFAFSE